MNETIQTQLNHRSIRAFKEQDLTKEEVELLVNVASIPLQVNLCKLIQLLVLQIQH